MRMSLPVHFTTVAIAFLVYGAALATHAQPKDTRDIVKEFTEQIDNGEAVDSAALYRLPPGELLPELKKYLSVGSDKVRLHSASVAVVIGQRSDAPDLRKEVVELLMNFATEEKDAGHTRWVLEKLSGFAKADFTETAKDQVLKLVRSKHVHGEAFLVAGTANVVAAKEELKKWARQGSDGPFLLGNRTWSANLALARLGDADAAKFCVEKLEAEKDIVQRVRRFPDLAYTRHEAASKLLAQYLMSDERLPSTKPRTFPGTKVASYALDVLAQSIDGFPVKSEGPSYTEDKIATARAWVEEQKKLTFKP
jgi:hypothetical protein